MSEREIFMAALDLPAAERTEYLAKVCGTDAVVRSRVEALLRSYEAAGSFLGTPAVAPHDPDSASTRTIGREGAMTDNDEIPLWFLEPATRPDSLGRIGHYEVLQVLGQGGFGIVFRAFDAVLHRVVAVKVLSPQMASTSPARKRFLREARSSAQVRHENVVQVYEVGETPLPYIVMEFIPGETLQQRLDRIGPVDVPEVVRIGRQIAEGLAAAHANDLIHRDIKPGNVLIEGGAQRVKITDFGLARAADDASISQSGIIAGTPMYMAPEQAKGDKLDQRADLFSLGSLLYQMASGRAPFRANGTLAVLKRVAEDTPRAIREIVPETPQWLCDIISKLHAKKPDERYQTAREVADVLADCEAQLKLNGRVKDFSRIPNTHQPLDLRTRGRIRKAVLFAGLPILAALFVALIALMRPRNDETGFPTPPAPGGRAEQGNTKTDPSDDDRSRFQGRWRMIALEQRGKSVPVGEHLFGYRTEFIGETSVTYAGGKALYAPFTLNANVDPKELDVLTRGQGPIRHLYRFDGDNLVVALGGPGQPRPTGFRTNTVTPFSVAICVRDSTDGWVQLFNGKDKTGWKTRPEAPGHWEVKDGILIGSRLGSVLYSERGDYANFHLRVETKVNLGGDSGIFFRTGFSPRSYPGFEVEIHKNLGYARKTGTVQALQSQGPPLILGLTADDSLTQPDEWFTLEIIVERDHFISKVNGKETANCRDPDGNRTSGHLGLQVWSADTVVQFRKIEIMELPSVPVSNPEPPVAINSDRKAAEYVLSIGGTVRIDGAGSDVRRLTELPKGPFRLTGVGLGQNEKVTDAGLVVFRGCEGLTELALRGTQVSDAGLAHFKDCKGLKHITLQATKVTATKIEELKKALPGCMIEWDGGLIERK